MQTDIVTEDTASAVSDAVISNLPPYPGTFRGRGVVICGGGEVYYPSAWVTICLLRHLGCTLPIELWHLGRHEMDLTMEAILAPLNVRCVDASEVRKKYPARILNGWELKPYAILHSRFREVLFLDADNLAVINPEPLFDTQEYAETGALFWPDTGRLGPAAPIWRLCGVPYQDERDFESGQIVVDKRRCWEPLCLTMWYNEHSDLFYRYIHGDKETFHMAWRKLNRAYKMPQQGIIRRHDLMYSHDFAGALQFQHQKKWTYQTRDAEHIVHGPACLSFLQQLRERWDGTISATDDEMTGWSQDEGTGDAPRTEKVSDVEFDRLPRTTSPVTAENVVRLLPASGRRTALVAALSHLARLAQYGGKPPVLIEIGTICDVREEACNRDGWSTLSLAWFAAACGGELHAVDTSPESLQCSRDATRLMGKRIHFHQRDGATFLREFDRPIDLLYLDAWSDSSTQNTARYLDAYRRLSDKPAMILIDDVPEGHMPAMATHLISEGYDILPQEEGLLTLISPQAMRVPEKSELGFAPSTECYNATDTSKVADIADIECAVITVHRLAGYVYDTVDALVEQMPLRLLVGSPDDAYVARYRSHPDVMVVETDAEGWKTIEPLTLQQRASWNHRRALLATSEKSGPSRGLLLFEDDVLLADDWLKRLRAMLEDIYLHVGPQFVLSLYTPWDFPSVAAERGQGYVDYPYDLFYGAQGLYYSAALRCPFADYLQAHAVERNEVPLDHALRDFCRERAVPMLQCAPCLVQHQGRQSTGLGFWHSAPCFTP